MSYQYQILSMLDKKAYRENPEIAQVKSEKWLNSGGNADSWAEGIASALGLASTIYQGETAKEIAKINAQSAQATANQDTIINITNSPTASIMQSPMSKTTLLIIGGSVLLLGTVVVIMATRKK